MKWIDKIPTGIFPPCDKERKKQQNIMALGDRYSALERVDIPLQGEILYAVIKYPIK